MPPWPPGRLLKRRAIPTAIAAFSALVLAGCSETDPPKNEYRCLLAGLIAGAPRVSAPGKAFDPCN